MSTEERNVYVGHRYVPKLMDEWDKTIAYEGLSIVTYQGTSYTSKKGVPVGVDILNEEYWTVTGNYNAQVEQYRQDVKNMEEKVTKDLVEVKEGVEQTGTFITSFQRNTGEGDSDFINRIINNLTNEGKLSLTLKRNSVYEINKTIKIPSNFTLNLNGSEIRVNDGINTNMFVLGLRSNLINGRLKIYNPSYNSTVISFTEQARIEFSTLKGLRIEGWWDGELNGTAIDLYARNAKDVYTYLSFEDIRITSFEYGIRIRITKSKAEDNLGAWINANTFTNIRFSNTRKMIDFDGDYWTQDFKGETSGNMFKGMECQITSVTEYVMNVQGNMNYFDGVIWDEGTQGYTGTTIICNEKAKNNVFDFPDLNPSKQLVNTHKNTIKNFTQNYGSPTSFERLNVPFSTAFPTFNGNQDDYLIYGDKRFNVRIEGEIPEGEISKMFDPTPIPTYWRNVPPNAKTTITIQSKYEDSFIAESLLLYGVVFDQIPSSLKLTVMDIDNYESVLINERGDLEKYYFSNRFLGGRIKRITIEMEANKFGRMGISRFFGVSTENGGQTYLRRDGIGSMLGNVEFEEGNSIILKDENGIRRKLVFQSDGNVVATSTFE